MEIRPVDFGIANKLNKNLIIIHKDLLKRPDLYPIIIKHEISHTNKFMSWKDFFLDFSFDRKLYKNFYLKLYLFMLKRPKTWVQFSPVIKYQGVLYWDIAILLKLFIIFVFVTLLWFGFRAFHLAVFG